MDLTWSCQHHSELSKETLYALLRLRCEVFVVEQNCPYQDIDDQDLSGDTCHLMAHEGGQLLAYLPCACSTRRRTTAKWSSAASSPPPPGAVAASATS